MDITNLIKSKALELGFQKIGISSAKKPLHNQNLLDDWLNSGKHGTMQWMDARRDERKSINRYFPEVKSVISVAINYFTGNSDAIAAEGNPSVKFSNYSWGTDYHIIVKQRLQDLLEYIKNELSQDVKGLTCVDTSPILEKQWAQRAGIGWQGKHTLLINEQYGSWLFLGELLLDIPLDYDLPFENDLCRTCTACIDACPTNALTEYQLDSTKCIAYLTNEYKNEFDDLQKNSLNNWVFGCDICQQVCPWNKKRQKHTSEEIFQPRLEIQNYKIQDWINIDESSFKIIFKDSPIKRLKHNRFKRNINAINQANGFD